VAAIVHQVAQLPQHQFIGAPDFIPASLETERKNSMLRPVMHLH